MTKAILLAALLTGGCVAISDPDAGATEAAQPAESASSASCDASKMSSLVGQAHTPARAEEARKLSGAKTVRSLRPGDVMTMDYRVDRLNLKIDGQGKIEGANCG